MTALPSRLRAATAALHRQAEATALMTSLVQGSLPRARYLALLGELLPLYEALEAGLRAWSGAPWLAGLDQAALARAPGLRADLGGPPAAHAPLGATRAYVRRLQALQRDGDPALLAHVYTRYLGDLHGGQVLRRVVQRCYPGQGTAFHDFGDPAGLRRLREHVGAVLADAPLAAAEADRVVDEACWAFRQHHALFEELEQAGQPLGATP